MDPKTSRFFWEIRVSSLTLDECRAVYSRVRARSEARTAADFDAAVRSYMRERGWSDIGDELERARGFVRAALAVRFPCRRCGGTGTFVTYIENGRPRGPGGMCFRCAGRGTQSDADVRRNYGYDCYYARIA